MLLTTFCGSSQNLLRTQHSDSTIVPNDQLRAALKLIEKGKLCEKEVDLLGRQVAMLENRLNIKDSIVGILNDRLSIAEQIRETYRRDSSIYEMEVAGLNGVIIGLKKDLKKQKRKTFIARAGMVAIAGVGAYLILKP
ncbi:MAG TPA: hypothetical protein PLS87_11670 [Ferruginibacter sp.]|nr:hypothetical protein [Ferruginibacter sp.]